MLKTVLIVSLVAIVMIEARVPCTENFCARVQCKLTESNAKSNCEQDTRKVFLPKGGICGCCDACVTKISELFNCCFMETGFTDKSFFYSRRTDLCQEMDARRNAAIICLCRGSEV